MTAILASVRPRRSVLYMPGANERALEKAKTLPADSLILDLEDAVAPEAKIEARERVCGVVKAGGYGPRELVIRINGQDTEWGKADLKQAAHANPDAILAPKVSTADEIRWLDEHLSEAGAPAKMGLWVMIETPLSIFNLKEIASCGKTTRLWLRDGLERPDQGFPRRADAGARESGRDLHAGDRRRARL
jgi:citrate lyase subunit beta/citryl-CoA lyase